MARAVTFEIPYSRPSLENIPNFFRADLYLARISSTWDSVILAVLTRSPWKCRPLRSRSAMLSASVPSHRWAGLTQFLISHLWQTRKPSGIAPLWSSNENRCALTYFFLPTWCRPYPSLSLLPVQSQQDSVLSTNRQKRSTAVASLNRLWHSAEQVVRGCEGNERNSDLQTLQRAMCLGIEDCSILKTNGVVLSWRARMHLEASRELVLRWLNAGMLK